MIDTPQPEAGLSVRYVWLFVALWTLTLITAYVLAEVVA